MAINAQQVSNTNTLEQLRSQFNNLVTDVSALESGTLNFGTVSASNISVGELSITGSLELTTVEPSVLNLKSDRMSFEGTSDDNAETTFVVSNPTADRTITFKNESGTVAFTADLGFTNSTLTQLPTSEVDFDLGDLTTGAVDAFGFSTANNLYDMNEPKGSTAEQDLGANTSV
jgi:hypothetical protein|tara:strand:- start:885 stop:1406 length:522 start_codon:yes stop_codon:yes gene_type:complete